MKFALVADDEAVVLNLVASVVESFGFEVTVCDNGSAALKATNNHHFDLVICDNHMDGNPDRWGTEVIKNVQHHNKDVKTILMSGESPESHTADKFLLKPFSSIEELENAILSLFSDL